jgi:hypothetical protein
MIRKITVIVASGDADTQWRRIRKSAELRAEHSAERGVRRGIRQLDKYKTVFDSKYSVENGWESIIVFY